MPNLMVALNALLDSIPKGDAPLVYAVFSGYVLTYFIAYALARAWSGEHSTASASGSVAEAVYRAWMVAFLAHVVYVIAWILILQNNIHNPGRPTGNFDRNYADNYAAGNYLACTLLVAIDLLLAWSIWRRHAAAREEWRSLIN